MKSACFLILCFLFLGFLPAAAQQTPFGKNKVQYKDFEWYYIQSDHFDIYFSKTGETIANFSADIAESSYAQISKSFRYQITNRIPVIVYNSHNDFQQTNVVNEYLDEGIGGVTELFKNRVILPFEGDYKKFRHVIHHELVHAVINDMFYGGSIQSIITNNITLQLPLWFNEGLAEFEALRWDTNSDMFLRDATIHEYLPPIEYLGGYFAYRGGQSVWNYIALKYGDQKIADILMRVKATRNVDQGFRAAIGLSVKELSDRWEKEQKVLYWPDIAKREEAVDYARRLTDHSKEGGFYNTSPAISPKGDKVAYISNKDEYFDVYLMNTSEGSTPEKIIKGQRTADFEELHLLTPGMSWSSDGKRLALATKSGARDAIIIYDTENDRMEKIDFNLDGIFSIDWAAAAPDSGHPLGKLAFAADNHGQSDIYIYDLDAKKLTNLTNDIFSDAEPAWSSDGKSIYFSSDRKSYVDPGSLPGNFKMQRYDFSQADLYKIDVGTRSITRITDLPASDETSPVATPDGRHLLFISDMNGINNIYVDDLDSGKIHPLTNSLSGVYQLTLSQDGGRLIFSTLSNGGFDLFLMRSPAEQNKKFTDLEKTEYFRRLAVRYKNPDTLAAKKDTLSLGDNIIVKTHSRDSAATYGNEVKVDLHNYVFSDAFREHNQNKPDSATFQAAVNNLDTLGNYKVNRYKLNFSPDIVYGNAGYSTFYGIQGSTIFAFSDLLGDHQIYIISNLLFDLKNSDFAVAYLYLPKRIDYGIQLFHQARFLFLTNAQNIDYLYRFRNYGVTGMASFPMNRFNRWEMDLTWYNLMQENLDDPFVATQHRTMIVPTLSYIHDTSLWDIISPGAGERYNVSLITSPSLGHESSGFWSLTADYRTYFRLGRHYNLLFRFAGGGSFGANPQRFVIGGVDNWINRQFQYNRYPIDNPEDIVFLTFGVPLRGYDYNQRIGTKYGIFNTELRFPLFGYLTAGPLPLFFQTLNGILFLDAGGAWTHTSDFKGIASTPTGEVYLNDLLVGAGYGVRMVFLGFLLKMDVAWPIDMRSSPSPKYYFSLGTDL